MSYISMLLRPLLIVIGFGALFLLISGCGFRAEKTPMVTLGHGRLDGVRFPEPWTKTNATGDKTVFTVPEYEVRRSINELVFTTKAPDGSYSENFYAVSLDGRFTVRPATTEEWNRAERVEKYRHQILSRSDPNLPQNVYFRNKTFTKSGESWGSALVSSSENWLALLSYTSKEKTRETQSILSFLGGGEPSKGEIFLDVYDTSSGKKILAGHAPFSGFGPSILFDSAFWSSNRYIILPLDTLSQTAFLGILPGEKHTD